MNGVRIWSGWRWGLGGASGPSSTDLGRIAHAHAQTHVTKLYAVTCLWRYTATVCPMDVDIDIVNVIAEKRNVSNYTNIKIKIECTYPIIAI